MKTCLSLLCLLAVAAGDAAGATLAVNGWTSGESVTVISAGRIDSLATAELDTVIDGASGFSYCVDLAQSIGLGGSNGWDLRSPLLSDSVIRAAWLVDEFQPVLDEMTHSANDDWSFGVTHQTAVAALQVAVWEVMSETAGDYDLWSGNFAIAEGGASDGVMNLSRDFLGALGGADLASYQTNALWAVHAGKQDQLFFTQVNPIPEPSTVALYLFGAAIGAVSLRTKLR
jgi:hypothetical protein